MKNRINFKNAIAVIVIIASFLLAIGLALLSNSRLSYWVATKDLTPGHMVDSTDFTVVKGAFGKEVSGYITSEQSPVGFSIAKHISAGEYLNQSALLESDGESNVKLLSFAVAAADLPAQLVIEGVFIVNLNRKSENLGGASFVTVAIPNDFVEDALNATRRGRMVVVINHG